MLLAVCDVTSTDRRRTTPLNLDYYTAYHVTPPHTYRHTWSMCVGLLIDGE